VVADHDVAHVLHVLTREPREELDGIEAAVGDVHRCTAISFSRAKLSTSPPSIHARTNAADCAGRSTRSGAARK